MQGFKDCVTWSGNEFFIQLCCPLCGASSVTPNIHRGVVELTGQQEATDPEIPTQQGGYRLFFYGECGHCFALDIGVHKGETFLRWMKEESIFSPIPFLPDQESSEKGTKK